MDKGLAFVALGAVAWLAAGVYYGGAWSEGWMVGLLLVGVGFALCAWAVRARRGLAVAGFAVAALGIVLFLGPGFGSFANLARVGSHAFLVALVLMAAGLAASRPLAFRAGAALGLVAVAFWLVADADGGGAWQPGNLLAGAGIGWAMVRPPLTRG